MKIQSFEFSNHKQNWHIEKVSFDELNLLVGASGVGKTRILRALDLICDVAQDKKRNLDDLEWSINFSHLHQDYKWELKSSSSDKDIITKESDQSEIEYEKLIRYDGSTEVEILHRSSLDSKFNNERLPKLKRTESAIALLSEEESIIPVGEAFKRLIFNFETRQNFMLGVSSDPDKIWGSEDEGDNTGDIHKFKEELAFAPPILKALILQKFFTSIFDEIKEYYMNIFPEVKDVRVATVRELDGQYTLSFEIKEIGLEGWIPQQRISSGMFRTLICLVEVIAAPDESVISIDEFENSLGINCMPELTEFILDKSPNIQFILTSHHPYIINNIPWDTWQIVNKSGSKVKVRKAKNIPELNTASSLDKFTQLVDLLDYEEVAE